MISNRLVNPIEKASSLTGEAMKDFTTIEKDLVKVDKEVKDEFAVNKIDERDT